jgi:hypothetical protein
LRAVITPSNGAVIFSYETSSARCATLACAARFHVADLGVGVLLRDRLGLQHVLPALRGGLRVVEIGLRGGFVGAGLAQLRVQIGRFDRRENLAAFHLRADVGVPMREIAARARVDRGFGERHHGAGQQQFIHARRGARLDHRNDEHALRLCLLGERGAGMKARHDAGDQQRHGEAAQCERPQTAARFRVWVGFGRGVSGAGVSGVGGFHGLGWLLTKPRLK